MELPEKRKRVQEIRQAIEHEQRLRLHTDKSLHETAGITSFLRWVEDLLPTDKYEVFKSLFRLPPATVGLSESIFNALSKVHDSKDARIEFNFENEELKDDFVRYISQFSGFWQNVMEIVKKNINSVIVIDLPQTANDAKPEPYMLEVKINRVYSFDLDDNGDFLFFAYYGDEVIYYIDKDVYRTYSFTDRTVGNVIFESRHNLGFVPARFFWTDSISQSIAVKQSPITSKLAELDWLLYFTISKKHLDNYAAYPIYSAYEQHCDYVEQNTGKYCDGGFLKTADGNYSVFNSMLHKTVEKCPVCSSKRFGGVGSFIEIPIPDEETPDLSNPVRLTSVDRASLDYNTNEVDRLQQEIFNYTTGNTGNFDNKQAINEKQVIASLEGRKQVIFSIKRNLENIQKFCIETIGKLRYGEGFNSAYVNWGTDFYLHTPNELYEIYANAQNAGVSKIVLDKILRQIYETLYRNDPAKQSRALVSMDIEPYVHMTDDQVLALYQNGIATLDDVRIKYNYTNFLAKFEAENTSIDEFGIRLNYHKKIAKIKQTLLNYSKISDNNGKKNEPTNQ